VARVLVILLVLATALPAFSDPPKGPVKSLKVIVRTVDDWGAGTTDTVTLSMGDAYEWTLAGKGETFKPGNADTFVLGTQGLNVEDIKAIKLRKSRGADDDWGLKGLEIWINGRPFYRNNVIELTLHGGHLEWVAPDFPKKP